MGSEKVVSDHLLARVVEGAVVTKAEMVEAIHVNNQEIVEKIDAVSNRIDTVSNRVEAISHELRAEIASTANSLRVELQSEMTNFRQEMRSEMTNLRQEVHSEVALFRTEARSDRRWLIGLFITSILAMPALLKLLGHI